LHWPGHAGSPPHNGRAGVAVRCGVPVTGVQVPTDPLTSQAWHWPAHARSQQTPSMQLPLAQSPPTQACPLGRATHVPPLQTGLLPEQSELVQQLAAGMQALPQVL